MRAFIGTVLAVGFDYAPRGWVFCNGQLLSVTQHAALFSLLGTRYGGDGVNLFGVPDLRGRVVVGAQASGPGLQNIVQGEKSGANVVTVLAAGEGSTWIEETNLPAHTHVATTILNAGTGTNGAVSPTVGSFLTATAGGVPTAAAIYAPSQTSPVPLSGISTTLDTTGGGQPLTIPVTTTAEINVMPPYIGLNYIICTEGVYPFA